MEAAEAKDLLFTDFTKDLTKFNILNKFLMKTRFAIIFSHGNYLLEKCVGWDFIAVCKYKQTKQNFSGIPI